jgi:hypothetical protein
VNSFQVQYFSYSERTPKQLEDHYNNYLRPGINKEPWTFDEDLLLMNLLRVHGKDWDFIEGKLKGRTHNQIKNRYYGRLKRIEDKKL